MDATKVDVDFKAVVPSRRGRGLKFVQVCAAPFGYQVVPSRRGRGLKFDKHIDALAALGRPLS